MLTAEKPLDAKAMVADLIDQTAHIPADMLDAGIARWRKQSRFWPQAAQLIQACAHAERDDRATGDTTTDKAAAYARSNLDCIRKGVKVMQTASGELFKLGDRGEMRGVQRDGSAIEPFFRKAGEVEGVKCGWYVRQDEAEVLAACYRHYGAEFTVRGSMVVRAAA